LLLQGGLEVFGLDVFCAGHAVAECFEQHELIGVVDSSRPVEPEVGGLGLCGFGEPAAL
jgi:hypothetical protein